MELWGFAEGVNRAVTKYLYFICKNEYVSILLNIANSNVTGVHWSISENNKNKEEEQFVVY